MLKSRSGLATVIKHRNPSAKTAHCIITEIDSDNEKLLFYTEVCWLSKGNMLEKLYKLRIEIKWFLGKTNI